MRCEIACYQYTAHGEREFSDRAELDCSTAHLRWLNTNGRYKCSTTPGTDHDFGGEWGPGGRVFKKRPAGRAAGKQSRTRQVKEKGRRLIIQKDMYKEGGEWRAGNEEGEEVIS